MFIINDLIKVALEMYPININVHDDKIEDEPKYLLLINHIRQKRIDMPVAEILQKVKVYFLRNTCRDTTYLYNTNPCFRIEIISQKLIFTLLISLLADVYTIKQTILEQYKTSKNLDDDVDSDELDKICDDLLPNFEFVQAELLEQIPMPEISCNSKMLGDATLFDCFFNDN